MPAPVIGAYLLLSAFGMLRSRDALPGFARDLAEHPAAMHGVGAVAFFVGAGIVSFHRHWGAPAEIVVSATGLWWAFEGAGMLASPARVAAVMREPGYLRAMRWINVAGLLPGAYLLAVALVAATA